MTSIKNVSITKFKQGQLQEKEDVLAVEEPLEISLQYFENGEKKRQSISITMRTPDFDKELALGFLYTEGIMTSLEQLEKTTSFIDNQITIHLKEGASIDLEKLKRNFYTTSSCGVCGKSSIDAIRTIVSGTKAIIKTKISPALLLTLKDKINQHQSNFSQTGGIHASALFDMEGNLISLYEDVGRHNALDKLIGHHFVDDKLDFEDMILLLSGRASFELIQKAIMAKIPVVCAIGAPSSLAVELADEFGITLIGFLKNDSFNVYTGKI
ncbi:MAG: formate dehydrogenase accessory sulfurtransferase FdhD [Chitinophagales bacterium]|jgi:FdhD protein|nr:formate dehydrogenase accessory sulfurtransferase FdhD [Sphingobacteriales bacterium]